MLWLCFWLLFNARAYSPDGAVVDWTTAYLAPATRLPHAVEASACLLYTSDAADE